MGLWYYGRVYFTNAPNFRKLNCSFSDIVDGQDIVVHLITNDIYIDLKFTSWTSGNIGGGFAYERSTDQSLSSNGIELENSIILFPNPSAKTKAAKSHLLLCETVTGN